MINMLLQVNGDTLFVTSNFKEFRLESSANGIWDEQNAVASTAVCREVFFHFVFALENTCVCIIPVYNHRPFFKTECVIRLLSICCGLRACMCHHFSINTPFSVELNWVMIMKRNSSCYLQSSSLFFDFVPFFAVEMFVPRRGS